MRGAYAPARHTDCASHKHQRRLQCQTSTARRSSPAASSSTASSTCSASSASPSSPSPSPPSARASSTSACATSSRPSYAAQAVGYLTGRPGACLVVSGPGMTNAISGLANAWSNNWPMILIGGASDLSQDGMGAFQDAPQVEAARPFTKYAIEVEPRRASIPYFVEQAVRTVDLRPPRRRLPRPPRRHHHRQVRRGAPRRRRPRVARAAAHLRRPRITSKPRIAALKTAERPLVIVGKGAAYADAADEVRALHRVDAAAVPRLADGQGRHARRPPALRRRRPLARPPERRPRLPRWARASTGSCTSACRRASTRTSASSRWTSPPRRSAPTSRPRSPSSATRRRSRRSSTPSLAREPVAVRRREHLAHRHRRRRSRTTRRRPRRSSTTTACR